VRALVFYAGSSGRGHAKLPIKEVVHRLARAAGYVGSCAMYLYRTICKLEEHGIHDRHLWHLQELVAAEIAAMAPVAGIATAAARRDPPSLDGTPGLEPAPR
jgi:cation transport protein ChaC